jgi:hypothetical protein
VYTPKGSRVAAYSNSELSSSEINNYNRISDAFFTTDIRITNASRKYNNFSYAFYKQNTNNNYYIDDPYLYLSDGSYIEISYSNLQPRDRIVYYNSNNEIVHSGVVRGTTGQTPNGVCGYANTVWVQSKWGYYGLYEHRGDQCPYTNLVSGGTAVSVKFYRYNINHSHRYTYTALDSNYHYASCECGDIIVEHTYEQQQIFPLQTNEYETNYISNYVCTYCGYTSSTGGIL